VNKSRHVVPVVATAFTAAFPTSFIVISTIVVIAMVAMEAVGAPLPIIGC
jgi:hypothetical protein